MTNIKNIPMMNLLGLHKRMEDKLGFAFSKVLNDSKLINGSEVEILSRSLEDFLKVKHALPCANGTDALQLAVLALDLPKGSEIIVPSHNYISGPEMIVACGHVPVFCDVDLNSFNATCGDIDSKITSNTKAIIITHLYGQAADMQDIMSLARTKGLKVIEDNAQSFGADSQLDNEVIKAGTIGDIGTTSFYPTKVLGCLGDGGAVFTNSDEYADKVRLLSQHGQSEKFKYNIIGFNTRLDTLQAAILNVKLNYLDDCINRRRMAASWYDELLNEQQQIITPEIGLTSTHVYHHYTIRFTSDVNRDEVRDKLEELGVETAVIYPNPIHLSKAFDFQKSVLPITEQLSNQILSLPMHTELTKDDVSYIAESLIKSL